MARCTEGPYVFFWREEYMYHLPRKIKAASSLRSRWSHIPGGEQKAEDADGKIDQEDAAPPKRVDASVKRARPAKNTVLLPLLSPSAPPVSRKLAKTRAYPSTIHWSPVTSALSCSLILTNATFTIVTSRIVMK